MTRTKQRLAVLNSLGYGSWVGMRSRCNNKRNKDYQHYGGRGICVHNSWSTFEEFLRDMGPRPPGHSIERIDTNGNYEKSNCKWVKVTDQPKNTRLTVWFNIDGLDVCMKDACRIVGASYSMVRLRVWKLGWDKYDALYIPPKGIGRPKKQPSLKGVGDT